MYVPRLFLVARICSLKQKPNDTLIWVVVENSINLHVTTTTSAAIMMIPGSEKKSVSLPSSSFVQNAWMTWILPLLMLLLCSACFVCPYQSHSLHGFNVRVRLFRRGAVQSMQIIKKKSTSFSCTLQKSKEMASNLKYKKGSFRDGMRGREGESEKVRQKHKNELEWEGIWDENVFLVFFPFKSNCRRSMLLEWA